MISVVIHAQTRVSGKILDADRSTVIAFAQIQNTTTQAITISNENGLFLIEGNPTDSIKFTSLGYSSRSFLLKDIVEKETIQLTPSTSYISCVDIEVNKDEELGIEHIDKLNLKLQPVKNAQELLTTMSGVFIAQHAGGGKAEQIFLRGFDNDHGTDFAVYIDDVPINLSSHAHGQGYADMHFIIPELIEGADYYKGLYEVKNGNFAISGAARYKTKNALSQHTFKTEIGEYGFQRGLLMLNLTPKNHLFRKEKYENAYVALEGTLNKGFFDAPQDFKKWSGVVKYSTDIGQHTSLKVNTSYFTSSWNASGQIPLRAVQDNSIGWVGHIDSTEGGNTSRLITSVKTSTFLNSRQKLTQHAYYSHNQYQLFSNFTFNMNDPVNGDMITQGESRNIYGYSVKYESETNHRFKSVASAGLRADFIHSSLISAIERNPISTINENKVGEVNYWAYVKENWNINANWLLQIGSRVDYFRFMLRDQTGESISGNQDAIRFSPKMSLYFNPRENWQLFVKAGQGYHSNYTHAAVQDKSVHPLPKALSSDVGFQVKLGNNFISTCALWAIRSDAEYLFVADAGEFENNGASFRKGADVALKYNPVQNLWFNLSMNYSKGILLEEPKESQSIPSAPRFTSTSSVTYKYKKFDFYLGTRYMARRPLVEDESIFADSYFLVNQSVFYTTKKIQVGLSVQNLLNSEWMEAVFYDASQLKGEVIPVDDFHFTPGTPRFTKILMSYFF